MPTTTALLNEFETILSQISGCTLMAVRANMESHLADLTRKGQAMAMTMLVDLRWTRPTEAMILTREANRLIAGLALGNDFAPDTAEDAEFQYVSYIGCEDEWNASPIAI